MKQNEEQKKKKKKKKETQIKQQPPSDALNLTVLVMCKYNIEICTKYSLKLTERTFNYIMSKKTVPAGVLTDTTLSDAVLKDQVRGFFSSPVSTTGAGRLCLMFIALPIS